MNLLLVNNYYYLRGGSENVFHSEINLLRLRGHEVSIFCRTHPLDELTEFGRYFPPHVATDRVTPSISGIKTLTGLFYARDAQAHLRKFLGDHNVDLVHAHNIYGRLTTSILDEFARVKIPVVLTLHDYKLICPNYKLENNGKICEKCRGSHFYNALLTRCHKNSLIASGVYAAEAYFSMLRKSYARKVFRLISPSRFLRDKFIEFGWDPRHIVVIPNFLDAAQFVPDYDRGDYFLFLGRLSPEKGLSTLLEAYSKLPDTRPPLHIAGTGPLESSLKQKFQNVHGVIFLGHLTGDTLKETIRKSLAVIVPSQWYENAPMSILEAMAFGKPVIGANIGGIPEMVHHNETGLLFQPAAVDELREALLLISSFSVERIVDMGKKARCFVEQHHSPETHYEKLMQVYQQALNSTNRTTII